MIIEPGKDDEVNRFRVVRPSRRRTVRSVFKPRNQQKYIGNTKKIVARSSWELAYMAWLDNNPAVLHWSSEEVIVPYVSPLDGQPHRYFVDFYVHWLDTAGKERKRLVELKPAAEMYKPKNKQSRSYPDAVRTYLVNQAKWEAADRYAKAQGWDFKVLNEYDLGMGRKKMGSYVPFPVGQYQRQLAKLGPVGIRVRQADPRLRRAIAGNILAALKARGKSAQPTVGRMYFYQYDAKYKDVLPYWDTQPLVIPINFYPNGWLGINFHYLDVYNRAALLDALIAGYASGGSETRRLQLSYELLKGVSEVEAFKPCLHRYLRSHVASPIIQIQPNDWALAVTLPLARFTGARQQHVHAQSRSAMS